MQKLVKLAMIAIVAAFLVSTPKTTHADSGTYDDEDDDEAGFFDPSLYVSLLAGVSMKLDDTTDAGWSYAQFGVMLFNTDRFRFGKLAVGGLVDGNGGLSLMVAPVAVKFYGDNLVFDVAIDQRERLIFAIGWTF